MGQGRGRELNIEHMTICGLKNNSLPGRWDDVCAGSEMVLARRGSHVAAVGWDEHGNLGVGLDYGVYRCVSACLCLSVSVWA